MDIGRDNSEIGRSPTRCNFTLYDNPIKTFICDELCTYVHKMHCNGYLVYYFIANQIALIYWLFWVWDLGFWHYGTMKFQLVLNINSEVPGL